MKKKSVFIIATAGFGLAILLTIYSTRNHSIATAQAAAAKPAQSEPLIAGPGRVEPVSEDIKIGSELSGKLRSVLVDEGDHIRKGQVLAVLENDDYRAEVQVAQADVSAKEATLRKVVNGARSQERGEALSSVREAEAVMNNALSEKAAARKVICRGRDFARRNGTRDPGIQRRQSAVSRSGGAAFAGG